MVKKLILVDGNNLMFRSYYATAYTGNMMKNSKGVPTNALFGFVGMINKIIAEEKPSYMAVAFDIGKNFRKEEYDFYKEGRIDTPEELKIQMPIAREILDKMGIKHFELAPYEADDIVGTIVKMTENDKDFASVIVSSDKDLLQLISDETEVKLLKQTGFIRYNHETFVADYGIEPIRMIDLKALMGDSSDNIPGVKGIGEKTALKLLQEYKTLENIYDNCKEYNSINSRYLEYVRKKEEYSAILNTSQNTIDQFKTKYHIFEDIGSYLKNLSSNSNTLKNDKKNLEEKIEQAKTYKEKNKLLEKPQKSEISIEKLDLEKDAILLKIKNLEKAITENENELLTLPDIKNTIQDTHNKIQNIKHRIEIIEKTIFFFTTAENNLKNRFITPIYSSYTTYIQDFDSILKKGTSMDFNLNISFDIQGELKSYQHLSQGLLSILEVSLRFALIDNMYKKEKPSIILDDPFVYLDKDNLQIAKKVLQNLAKQNQIIYFCCHESRKI